MAQERVVIRSYRGVLDAVERRIFSVDRWRLPTPHGVSVRAIVYATAAVLAFAVAGQLPVVGQLLGVLPASVRYLALPLCLAAALSAYSPDGRAPHQALRSLLGFWARSRSLSALGRAPRRGEQLIAIGAVQLAPSGDEGRYRAGVISGPARVLLRYPAAVGFEGGDRVEDAKRLVISPRAGRAMPRGHELRIPAGRSVVFKEPGS